MSLEVQKRDIQIMKFVFACRAVTYDQIVRRHFPKTHEVVAWRRIRGLSNQGYFKVSVIELSGRTAREVQPLPHLWSHICEEWPIAIDTPHFKSESIVHDIRLAEVFLRLEKLQCFRSFFPENLLQSSLALATDPRLQDTSKLQSDGALTIVDAKGNLRIYAVELELSKKSPVRYRQKLVDYYLSRGIDGVLYITPEHEIEALVARIDQEIRENREGLVRFASEASVLSGTQKLIFSNESELNLELL